MKKYPTKWINAYDKLSKTALFHFAITYAELSVGRELTEAEFVKLVKKEQKLWSD